jgi:Cdc6-like AAA superfamily ATPase
LAALTEKNSDMMVIFAGYKEEMDRLMTMNPGLKGRFPYEYHFADYTAEQLMQIAEHLFEKDEYLLTPDARRELQTTIEQTLRQPPAHFGNARWVEQYVRNGILPALADRLVESKAARALTREDYQRVEASDIRAAYRLFKPETIELKPRLRVLGFSA